MDHLQMCLNSFEKLPPIPDLPDGYRLRECGPDDVGLLGELLHAAFPDMEWPVKEVRERLLEAPDVKRIYVVEHAGKLAATASARLMPDLFPDSGYLHWVAVDPQHRGQGLGTAVSIAVLQEFKRLGYHRAVLETQDERLAAIKIYKQMGFEEVHLHNSHVLRWAMVSDLLRSAGL